MQLVSKRNFLIFLAAMLVVGFAYMGFSLYQQNVRSKGTPDVMYQKELQMMREQSQSDEVSEIENDLGETDLENVDQELDNIEAELNTTY
jgi:hypothetical protein